MATLTQIKSDKRVKSISDERINGDGIWIYLKKGYFNFELETHSVHEQSIKEAHSRLKTDVKPCKCNQCKN